MCWTSSFCTDDWRFCHSILQVSELHLSDHCWRFSVTIYGQIGISADNTLKYQGINSIIALIAQFCTILFIDRTGRRWPLILGNLANAVTFIIAAILLAKFPPGVSNNHAAQWGFIIITWLFNFSFSCTCKLIDLVLFRANFWRWSIVLDHSSRSVWYTNKSKRCFNCLHGQFCFQYHDRSNNTNCNDQYRMVSQQSFESRHTNHNRRFYIVFVVCNFTNALFFWTLLPETARRPLEEMNELFTKAPWIVIGKSKSNYATNDLETLEREIIQAKRANSFQEDKAVAWFVGQSRQ